METRMVGFGSPSESLILEKESPLKLSACGDFVHERIPPLLMPIYIVRIETIWMYLCRDV